jgi:hypothetical protein
VHNLLIHRAVVGAVSTANTGEAGARQRGVAHSPQRRMNPEKTMELRSELMPPVLDKHLIARLIVLADELDGGYPEQTEIQLAAFNQLAGTQFEFLDFQGIQGRHDHETWVRKVLAKPYERRLGDVTKAELVELARRVMAAEGSEHALDFWLNMLVINIPSEQVSGLIFCPEVYLAGNDAFQKLTPELVIEIAMSDKDSVSTWK